jgi:hypothetical protein
MCPHVITINSGIIKEMAEMKVGSAEKLQNCIARGACKVKTNCEGIELFYFPDERVGARESFDDKEKVFTGRGVSIKDVDKVKKAMDMLQWRDLGQACPIQ